MLAIFFENETPAEVFTITCTQSKDSILNSLASTFYAIRVFVALKRLKTRRRRRLYLSYRKWAPFVLLNCRRLPDFKTFSTRNPLFRCHPTKSDFAASLSPGNGGAMHPGLLNNATAKPLSSLIISSFPSFHSLFSFIKK
jgi:hypothetical protein